MAIEKWNYEKYRSIWNRTVFELKLGIPLDFTALSRTGGTPTIKLYVHQTCGSLGLCICLLGELSGLSTGR